MCNTHWMGNVKEMVDLQYRILVLAGCPSSFGTWIEAVDRVRELIESEINASAKTRIHSFFKLVEFVCFSESGDRCSFNVPFPDHPFPQD